MYQLLVLYIYFVWSSIRTYFLDIPGIFEEDYMKTNENKSCVTLYNLKYIFILLLNLFHIHNDNEIKDLGRKDYVRYRTTKIIMSKVTNMPPKSMYLSSWARRSISRIVVLDRPNVLAMSIIRR